MSSILTILFAPADAVGHVMACIGIAEVLQQRGHNCVFIITDPFKEKLEKYGFKEELISLHNNNDENPAKFWAEFFNKAGLFSPLPVLEKVMAMNRTCFGLLVDRAINYDSHYKEIVNRVNPDIIIIDNFIWVPSLMCSGIPWIWSMSCNPLMIDYAIEDNRLPPSCMGLSSNENRELWPEMNAKKNEALSDSWNLYNDWLKSNGFPTLPENKLMKPSPYLNIYMFPKELDYTDIRQLSNWHQFDCFKRSGNEEKFELPEELRGMSGKLIYLSMGSMGGINLELMRKLVSMLSKIKHRVIVSKGPLSDQYELGDNMWGESTVPQIKVLPIVDLVITHGGNNTVTETFYFGKPMIILPLFVDQFDNAQRIEDKGFGKRLDPFNLVEHEFLDSIEYLLNDQNLGKKLKVISKRIQSDNSIDKIVSLIEGLKK